MPESFTFPSPPSADAIEWPGTPIGASNVITRTKTRTAIHDKAIDRQEGKRDALVNAAVGFLTREAGKPIYRHDVIIHGVRVRATTSSNHLYDYWVDNWYSPEEWKSMTGLVPPRDPQVTVFALGGVSDQPEAAYYSRKTSTIVFFNTAYYGQLKSWVLGAVGRVLAEDYGIHSIHGACVEKDGQGVLYIAPTGTGKSTSSYGLMTFPRTRFHSDDWVYVRYTYATEDGRRIHPMQVTLPGGRELRGYPVFRWLETDAARHADATLTGLDLESREVMVPVSALDFSAPLEAHAFTSEKIFYLRTNLVENFPLSAMQMLRSKMENVPDVSPAFLHQHTDMLDDLVEAIRAEGGEVTQYFAEHSRDEIKELLARMIAFDNARAMLDISKVVLPVDRVFINPMEPTTLSTVILLRRAKEDRAVAESLSLPSFITRLLIGETPDKKREIAYNAYRAVDDAEEQAYVKSIEEDAARRGGHGMDRLAEFLEHRSDTPETLREEFELFRVMHRACRCYSLNTVLTADPTVKDKKEAVALTLQLIARLVDDHPTDLRKTLDDYRSLISAPAR